MVTFQLGTSVVASVSGTPLSMTLPETGSVPSQDESGAKVKPRETAACFLFLSVLEIWRKFSRIDELPKSVPVRSDTRRLDQSYSVTRVVTPGVISDWTIEPGTS